MADPVNAQDAATKEYVDGKVNIVASTAFISIVKPATTNFTYNITSDVTNSFTVDWGDGSAVASFGNVTSILHVYPTAGVEYTVTIDGTIAGAVPFTVFLLDPHGELIKVLRCASSFKVLDFKDCTSLTEFNTTGLATSIVGLIETWSECSSLANFNASGMTVVSGTLSSCWLNCDALTTFDTTGMENVTSVNYCWRNCGVLASVNTSGLRNVTDITFAWAECPALTNFDCTNLINVQTAHAAWYFCTALTLFNTWGLENCTSVSSAWVNCTGITKFYTSGLISVTNATLAWNSCTSLSQFAPRSGCLGFVTVSTNAFASVPTQTPAIGTLPYPL